MSQEKLATVTLTRTFGSNEGTFGRLETIGFACQTGELPWRNNAPGISRVPAGTYRCFWAFSPRFKRFTYRLENVPERDGVLIHPANFMGDASKGFRCELAGCIALGYAVGQLEGQKALMQSRAAVQDFEAHMGQRPFFLEVIDAAH